MVSAGVDVPTLRPPAHISLPPWPDPRSSPDHSPYFTAPSSPSDIFFTPPSSPLPTTDDPFPTVDLTIDVALDDDSLTALDKIYLFTTSKATSHRVFIAHALPSFLPLVAPQDAIQYVLPLLSGLAMDQEEQVKEALATELVSLIWWFFSHCQIVPDEVPPPHTTSSDTTTISVQAFTPILGTLLLSDNPVIGTAARYAVVDLLARLRTADEGETDANPSSPVDLHHTTDGTVGLFLRDEREIFRNEILQQIVIGMARLDVDLDDPPAEDLQPDQPDQPREPTGGFQDLIDSPVGSNVQTMSSQTVPETYNPFFPPALPRSYSPPASPPIHSSERPCPPPPMASENSCAPMAMPDIAAPQWINAEFRGPRSPMEERWSSPRPPQSDWTDEVEGYESQSEGHQGAVGRVSSMSLMAAVAASGSLDGCIKEAFVKEVERVVQDPVYWVRREAAFALGALAKVVPEEIVTCSFLPLFDSLRRDAEWHVRHSALFALPAILSRLSPTRRRSLALETISTLCTDESPAVRLGVLEALGEVLYTFHQDKDGPPETLLQLFLGRKEDKRLGGGQQASPPGSTSREETHLESFYDDPERPLICAFNYPAVALTLGRARWPELRDVYREIAANRTLEVQRTIAASLGVLAEVIGKEHANLDLVDIWWNVIRNDDKEVRAKALESVDLLVSVLGAETGDSIVQGLVSMWDEGILNSWRERESIAKSLMSLVKLTTIRAHNFTAGLLRRALEDAVAAVRGAAVSALPRVWAHSSNNQKVLDQLREDLKNLSSSTVYWRRMTFVACQQALLTFDYDGQYDLDDDFWNVVSKLADDTVIGVRIGIARLLGHLSDKQLPHHVCTSGKLVQLIERLAQDPSCEVRSYLPSSRRLGPQHARSDLLMNESTKTRVADLGIFSRPPSA